MELEWYMDASFAVHPNFKSHGGLVGGFTSGKGGVVTRSEKQKLNTDSSTTAELVGTHQFLPKILYTILFLTEQGYKVQQNIVYEDNKSTILLEKNGKQSAGKQIRAMNICYYMIMDQIKKGILTVEYCCTNDMVVDYMTKGLTGPKFKKFLDQIMGYSI